MKRVIEIEFGHSLFDCPRASLFKVVQSNSVNEYYMEFTALVDCTHNEPPEALLDCFISGLKPDIRHDVVSQCLTTLLQAVALAKLYEEKYIITFKPIFSPSTRRTHSCQQTQAL